MKVLLSLFALWGVSSLASGQDPNSVGGAAVRAHAVRAYAAFAYDSYAECARRTQSLVDAASALCAAPDAAHLAAARSAWIHARQAYGVTEVLRFSDGPIDNSRDGVETLVNAWPVDESYIDEVPGAAAGHSVIADAQRFPNLVGAVLAMANERGGETNICTGWHAVEFVLWGQDTNPDGPGSRGPEVFSVQPHVQHPYAERRCAYLQTVTELLLEHICKVRDAWAPAAAGDGEGCQGGAYRARFEADPEGSLRKMVTGMVVLSGFELSGERMAVAYETRDQEEEHSCFSDTTHLDFVANQRGIAEVFDAGGEAGSLRVLARAVSPELGNDLVIKIRRANEAVAAIPAPFDRAIRSDAGRQAVLAAMQALEAQADTLAALGLMLGFEVPLQPGGG